MGHCSNGALDCSKGALGACGRGRVLTDGAVGGSEAFARYDVLDHTLRQYRTAIAPYAASVPDSYSTIRCVSTGQLKHHTLRQYQTAIAPYICVSTGQR
eukprot:858377-Rhodomonas_salina.2